MNLQLFKKHFPANIKPINIVNVSDIYLRKQIINFAEDLLKDTHQLTKFSLIDTEFNSILTYFKNTPMLGKKLLISVVNADSLDKQAKQDLINLLDKKHKFKNVIIFFFNKLKDKKLTDIAESNNCFYNIDIPDKQTIKKYIAGFFKKNNIKFESGIENFIIENVGTDLESVFFELQKINNYSDNLEILTLKDIKKIIFSTKEENIFKFLDAFFLKNFTKTFEILDNLLTLSTDVEQIISMLINTTITILNIKSLSKEHNLTNNDIKNKLHIHPYTLKKNYSLTNKFSFNELYSLLEALINTHYQIRSRNIKKELIFKNFLIEFLTEKT